ncbi:hypothetical protein [Actinoplanes sp. NPDC026619]|uniref:hypothetical protein n=1 Tax=Actinoplanes sp. NPDC026619 TaxID=3155798 RepID=UPI0033D58D1E
MADELSDIAKARKDLLWGMYADLRLHSRHAEMLRSTVVNFMIVIASLLIAAITGDGHVGYSDLVPCVGVMCVGLLGLGFAASYTELHERNRRRAMRLRDAVDAEFLGGPGFTLAQLLEESDQVHENSRLYRWSRRVTGSTQRFWFFLPALVLLAGVVLTAVAV